MTFYEVWFATPDGARFAIVDNYESLAWAKQVNGLGSFVIRWAKNRFDQTWFGLNNRVEVWRRPEGGRMYLALLGFMRYLEQGQEGGNAYVTIGGPDSNDLLNTRVVDALAGSAGAEKTGTADDVLKEYVYEALGAGAAAGRDLTDYGFTIQKDLSDGPAIVVEASYRNLLETCQEVADATYQLGTPVYFWVATPTATTFDFRTAVNQPGQDRTGLKFNAVVMTPEQERLTDPVIRQDWLEEVTHVYAAGQGTGSQRVVAQCINEEQRDTYRFNRREALFDGRSCNSYDTLSHDGCMWLRRQGERRTFQADIVDGPGNRLGKDWDFGDRVTAQYGAEAFPALVAAVGVKYGGDGETVEARIARVTDPYVRCTRWPNAIVGTELSGCYVAYVVPGDTSNPAWYGVNDGLTGDDLKILHLSISNPHGNRAYICTEYYGRSGGNMWRNDTVRDRGRWTRLTLPDPDPAYPFTDTAVHVDVVCADPQEPNTVYAIVNYGTGAGFASRSHLYRSTDGGDSWTATAVPSWGAPASVNVPAFSIYPADNTRAVAISIWTGRPRNQIVTTIDAVPAWANDGDSYGVASGFILANQTDSTTRYSYGLLGAPPGAGYLYRNRTILIFDDISREQQMNTIGAIVVESNARVRAVTNLTADWFRGVDDGLNQSFARATPATCQSVYGYAGWYYIGAAQNGVVGDDWHVLWVTGDDGTTWTGASGADPGGAGATSIPYDCGGVRHIAIWNQRPVGASTASPIAA